MAARRSPLRWRTAMAAAAAGGLLAAVPAARAADSTAELAIGGLVFTTPPDVALREETLFISPTDVRARYVVLNKSQKPITALVVFPLPDLDARAETFASAVIPVEDDANFIGFSARVDGRPVTAQLEQTAFGLGLERTATLRDAGIPLNPALHATWTALKALGPEARDGLRVAGLIDLEEAFPGDNRPDQLEPKARWLLKTTFFWQQLFPAGRETVVEHAYKPSVGISAGSPLADGAKAAELARYQQRFCVDDAFVKAAAALKKKLGPDAWLMEKRIDYTLLPGGGWGGPSGAFTAVIDKGNPDALVSFCAEEVKKLSPTQLEARQLSAPAGGILSILILDQPDGPANTAVPADEPPSASAQERLPRR
ncbi:hypothetical protein GCM10010994_32140 [Chelatococcus reniformis]|uniref:DUF4424 domain-containing protein n=2 Tax=Chelatococcus reniformis TaxID=1494448 RepID=A0A916UFT6_9HYPH|nr:hypothetical protein GCM10010994_32140 [Chelatococcus reniformis]